MPTETPTREPELVAAEAALMRQAPAIVDALVVQRDPSDAIREAQRAATELMSVVGTGLLEFNGKRYLQNEHWQTIGHFYGTTARLESDHYLELGETHGYEATAVLVARDGRIIGRASAMCLNDEPNWKKKPLFQIRSMAQTRASSRVYASVFRFVTVLAEVEGTPAEELDGAAPALPRTRDRGGHAHPYDDQPEHEDARDDPAQPVTIAKDRAARLPDNVVLIHKFIALATKNPNVTKYTLIVVGNANWPANMRSLSTINTNFAALAENAWNTERAVKIAAKKTKFGFDLESIEYAREPPAPARDVTAAVTDRDIPF
jgi:hypothetical protein